MNLHSMGIVYRKELRDLLRDWRAIMSMIVVPVVVVPMIILGVLKVVSITMNDKPKNALTMEGAPKVMLLGGEGSPESVSALRQLKKFDLVPASADYTNLISNKKIRAAVEIPSDFDAAVEAERKTTIHIYTYDGEPKSMQVAQELDEFFRHRREDVVRRRLVAQKLPETFVTPFDVQRTNVASPKQVTGVVIGMILPYLMIVMCLTGAIYPAIDMTTGEKERGTLETLLSSPVARTQLVLGKVLVVLTTSLATAALSLSANGLALVLVHTSRFAKFPMVLDPLALIGVCVVVIPLAVFISSVTITVGLFARSAKEANTYLQPMLLLAIIPAIIAALPGVEFNYVLAFIPVLNISLLSKELLSGACHWGHVLVVFGSMSVYAALAVAAAVALFKRESVLFRT
ncbi:MAG TPA: ABC transporter permease [Verrucomicrobiae bacterium]|nr:ABC transporter permease [Verrucomicrobiae bacterium]